MSPLDVPGLVAGKVVSPLALRMPHLDHAVPVPLCACAVTLEAGAGQHREARHRGGGQRGGVSLGPEAVQHKVWRQQEESLGGGRLGAWGAEHQPARVNSG